MSEKQELSQLGGYLHQDWDLDYDDVWDAVRAFKGDASSEFLDAVETQVRQLLEERLDEDGVKRVLIDELRIEYWPPGAGMTFRGWLQALARVLADSS